MPASQASQPGAQPAHAGTEFSVYLLRVNRARDETGGQQLAGAFQDPRSGESATRKCFQTAVERRGTGAERAPIRVAKLHYGHSPPASANGGRGIGFFQAQMVGIEDGRQCWMSYLVHEAADVVGVVDLTYQPAAKGLEYQCDGVIGGNLGQLPA
jgi:hypothetical protein